MIILNSVCRMIMSPKGRTADKKYREIQEHQLKKIVDRKVIFGQAFYMVEWKDGSMSWEPEVHLQEAINDKLIFDYNCSKNHQIQLLNQQIEQIKADLEHLQEAAEVCRDTHKQKKYQLVMDLFGENQRRKEQQLTVLMQYFTEEEEKVKCHKPQINPYPSKQAKPATKEHKLTKQKQSSVQEQPLQQSEDNL